MAELPRLEIDYPADGQAIKPGHYAFRISSSEALAEADVSVDRGPWRPCRHACGLWWFDWDARGGGAHEVVARGITLSGEAAHSTLRRFSVAGKAR